MSDIKRITVDLTPSTKKSGDTTNTDDDVYSEIDADEVMPNTPKKRSITKLESWQFSHIDLQPENQFSYITQLHTNKITTPQPCKIIQQHVSQKINGYKSQDIKKGLYVPSRIVDVPYVLDLLYKSSNICYYCKEHIQVLYENVREPKQWSLDRIFNDQGHNKENVVVACLKCNVSRKTMYHERYAFTKQLVIVKHN